MADRWTRTVLCVDHAGRSRTLEVFVTDDNKVALFAPAPGVAIVEPRVIHEVKEALTDAGAEVIRRRGAW